MTCESCCRRNWILHARKYSFCTDVCLHECAVLLRQVQLHVVFIDRHFASSDCITHNKTLSPTRYRTHPSTHQICWIYSPWNSWGSRRRHNGTVVVLLNSSPDTEAQIIRIVASHHGGVPTCLPVRYDQLLDTVIWALVVLDHRCFCHSVGGGDGGTRQSGRRLGDMALTWPTDLELHAHLLNKALFWRKLLFSWQIFIFLHLVNHSAREVWRFVVEWGWVVVSKTYVVNSVFVCIANTRWRF